MSNRSLATQAQLSETAILFSGVPKIYREHLYNGLKQYCNNPDYVFESDSTEACSAYTAITKAYNELCEVDKDQFAKGLDKLSNHI